MTVARVVAGALLLAAAGCASYRAYEGERRPASEAYLSASPELLGRLAAASKLFLEIGAGDGSVRRYELWKTDLTGLKAFVAQIQADSP